MSSGKITASVARMDAGDAYQLLITTPTSGTPTWSSRTRRLDEVAVDLVPVVMGSGRPFFGSPSTGDALLGDPTVCIQGDRVTHLVFPVL